MKIRCQHVLSDKENDLVYGFSSPMPFDQLTKIDGPLNRHIEQLWDEVKKLKVKVEKMTNEKCDHCGFRWGLGDSQWISIENDLPYDGEIVLVCDSLNNFVSLGRFQEDEEEYCFNLMNIEGVEIDSQITHWLPLPKPPGE